MQIQIPGLLWEEQVSVKDIVRPKGYKGLYAFHKYWGKKPAECMAFMIEHLSNPGDLVVDPFLGFGAVAREALLRERLFVGSDINPISIELTKLLINLPEPKAFAKALKRIEKKVKPLIYDSYLMENGTFATHYLWEKNDLTLILQMGRGIKRKEFEVSEHDKKQSRKYADYRPQYFRTPVFFDNSRINAHTKLHISDFFTGRALRNIDLIMEQISQEPENLRKPLLLSLTAAVGQMSKMVFAINNRGKNNGRGRTGRVEVGSWAIGYWRPDKHFEVNVWNCYYNKANALARALKLESNRRTFTRVNTYERLVTSNEPSAMLVEMSALELMNLLPDSSVKLLITDPPHSDRMPYLELSELWNSILGVTPCFDKEIVVSNAKQRKKDKDAYTKNMNVFFKTVGPKIADDGFVAVMFNARNSICWKGLHPSEQAHSPLHFIGCFPMAYSAGSIVQDNRKGSLKNDYVLLYGRKQNVEPIPTFFHEIPGWSVRFPK